MATDPSSTVPTTPKADTDAFKGACHCRAVTYTITLPADRPKTAIRCNCTFCQVPNFTNIRLVQKDDFKLITPSSRTDDILGDYNTETSPGIHRYFCRKCGTHVFRDIKFKVNENMTVDFLTVSVATLDQPQPGLELSEWKYECVDGRNGNWAAGSKVEPWKSGLV